MPPCNNPEQFIPGLLKCYDVYNKADVGSDEETIAKIQFDELVSDYGEAFERKYNLIKKMIKIMPDFPISAMLNMAYDTDTNALIIHTPYVYTLQEGETEVIDTKSVEELTCIYHSVSFMMLRNPVDPNFEPETGMCLQGFYSIPYSGNNNGSGIDKIWTVGLAPLGLTTLIHPSYKMN